jgi:hypothetical protein
VRRVAIGLCVPQLARSRPSRTCMTKRWASFATDAWLTKAPNAYGVRSPP